MVNLDELLIESERLWLRPIEMNDSQNIYECFNDAVTKYMKVRPNENLIETEAFIRYCILKRRKYEEMVMTIILRDTYEFIGLVGVHALDSTEPELGIWIKEAAFGYGYGREAIHSMVEVAEELFVCDGFIYPVDSRNGASQKIALSFDPILRKHYQVENASGFILEIDEYFIESK